MSDSATLTVTIEAPLQRCFDVVSDFERYPDWAPDIKETIVHERDAEGRATDVTYRAGAMGRSVTLRLAYDFSEAPKRMSWSLIDGDLLSRYDGYYSMSPAVGNPDDTELEYRLTVDLIVPIPGFVKRRAEGRIIKAALPDLKAHIEASG